MREIDKGLNAKTMTDLIIPSFELINEYLLDKNLKPEWVKEPERHKIRFTAPNGDGCVFSVGAENRWKTAEDTMPFPVVVFNFHMGNLNVIDTGSTPLEGLTPRRILTWFKGVFWLWLE
ncbi:MAG: hypothetical protein ABFD52_09295 [Acidobacteriota bacterium]